MRPSVPKAVRVAASAVQSSFAGVKAFKAAPVRATRAASRRQAVVTKAKVSFQSSN